MKIFFRYLFLRLLQSFAVCLAAITMIWIMVDLYGNLDEFLEHKIKFSLIFQFYLLNIPKMLVQVLPATLLFSVLFTLLGLNRRSELVAFQAGGMAPIRMFSPFLIFAVIWVIILAYDMSGPAATAEVTRTRVLQEVKGQLGEAGGFSALPYVDSVNHQVWFFQKLNVLKGKGSAQGIEILQRDAEGHDMKKYVANEAEWTGEFWRLKGGVQEFIYGFNGVAQDPKQYETLDLPGITTPPKQLSLVISQPDQLTLSQLSQYIATSTTTEEHLAGYKTEWWYRVLYPFSLIVFMLYALLQGARTNRRTAVAGVFGTVILLVLFTFSMNLFLAAGKFNRMSPFWAVATTEIFFGVLGLYLFLVSTGWWWQVSQWWKRKLGWGKRPVEQL